MSKLKSVDFKKRLRENAKELSETTSKISDSLLDGVSGYLVMAWDSSGNTALRIKPGGIVSQDAVAAHAFSQITQANARMPRD